MGETFFHVLLGWLIWLLVGVLASLVAFRSCRKLRTKGVTPCLWRNEVKFVAIAMVIATAFVAFRLTTEPKWPIGYWEGVFLIYHYVLIILALSLAGLPSVHAVTRFYENLAPLAQRTLLARFDRQVARRWINHFWRLQQDHLIACVILWGLAAVSLVSSATYGFMFSLLFFFCGAVPFNGLVGHVVALAIEHWKPSLKEPDQS